MTHLAFISGGEIFLVVLVIVVFFGANKVPDIARELGKGVRVLRDASNEVKTEIRNSSANIRQEYESNREKVQSQVEEVKKDVEETITEESETKEENEIPLPDKGSIPRT